MPNTADDLAAVIARVAQRYGTPHRILLAAVAQLTSGGSVPPLTQLEGRLESRAQDVSELTHALSVPIADPALAGWRNAAASALSAGQFVETDKALAQAELQILAGVTDLAQLPPERRLAAAEFRALRGVVGKIGLTQGLGREAAQRFAEAWAILGNADPVRSHGLLFQQADTTLRLAEEWNQPADYEAAAKQLRRLLDRLDNFEETIRWARIQMRLGVALAGLARLRGDRALLREAAGCHRTALEDLRREHDVELWLRLQRHLGLLCLDLGEAEGDRAALEEAVEAMRAAASATIRDADAGAWAAAQFDQGRALSALGRRSASLGDLEAAYNGFGNAAQHWTREVAPRRWAEIQHRMGEVLVAMGGSYSETVVLEEAVAAFGRALEIRRRETDLPAWAASTAGHAESMLQLARRGQDMPLAQQALAQLVEVVEVARSAGKAELAGSMQARLVAAGAVAQSLARR